MGPLRRLRAATLLCLLGLRTWAFVLGLPVDHRAVNDLLSPNVTTKHGVLSSGYPVLRQHGFVILSCTLVPAGCSVPFG